MPPTTRSAARAGVVCTSAVWYERWRGGDIANSNGWPTGYDAYDEGVGPDPGFYWFRVLITEQEFLQRIARCSLAGPYGRRGHPMPFAYLGHNYWGEGWNP